MPSVATVDGGREIKAGEGSGNRGQERNILGTPVPSRKFPTRPPFPDPANTARTSTRSDVCVVLDT